MSGTSKVAYHHQKERLRRSYSLVVQALILACLVAALGVMVISGKRQDDPMVETAAGVYQKDGSINLVSPSAGSSPGFEVRVTPSPFQVRTVRGGKVVMETTPGPARFEVSGAWHKATSVKSWGWNGKTLRLELGTTAPGRQIVYYITPEPGRYYTSWTLQGAGNKATRAGLVYNLARSGYWYGHGEVGPKDQPWPLNSGQVRGGGNFDPSIYQMRTPFWFTSSSVGLWVNSNLPMDVSLNEDRSGVGRFFVKDTNLYHDVTFVEGTPRAVYDRYIGATGKPAKNDTSYEQFEKPLWNTWAQFYRDPDQAKVSGYAEGLAAKNLAGHAVQIDGGWEPRRGDLEFDKGKFPDAQAMSDRVHELGFDLGLWVSFWIEPSSTNFEYARQRGYLLADGRDRSKPCLVPSPFGRDSGLVDLANPEARAWYDSKLRGLMQRYRVEGFKFDTVFFDKKCAPRTGYRQTDYTRIGVQFVDGFDMQGAGIRVPWWGSQRYGFAVRQMDKSTDWASLQTAVPQALALSTVGHPFVETDMIGGSLFGPPPEKPTLVRWAQAASLMPMMYSSTSPLGVTHPTTGQTKDYDAETVDLYRAAIEEHRRLAPYIWERAQEAVETGEPIMKPLFFDFPKEGATYTIKDQWMLGDAVMAAPVLADAVARDVYVPSGTWYDVRRGTTVSGPTVLRGYAAPLDTVPVFVLQENLQTCQAMTAFDVGSPSPCPSPNG